MQHSPGYCCWLATARRGRGQAIANTYTKGKCQLQDLKSGIGPASRDSWPRTQEMLPSSEANTSSSDILLFHFVIAHVSGVCALAAGCGLAQAEHHGVSRVWLVFWPVGSNQSTVCVHLTPY